MAEITAAMVKELRERSGLPMMDCKKALQETGGDGAKAMELLRKRGAAAAEKKAGRAMGEGRIGMYVDAAKSVGALAELTCETAPVGKNPDFIALAGKVAKHAALAGNADAATIGTEQYVDDPKQTVQDLLIDVLNRIRENMRIARVVRVNGRTAGYVHHDGKLGVLLVVEGSGGNEALLNDVCMHIAAMAPKAVRREDLPAEAVEKEKEIQRAQIIASGKPENMVDKILTGKMNRYFSEQVLLEQPFVKDDKKTVGKVLDEAGLKTVSFIRMQVGGA
ncbi:MAG: translation elongation factor Ts [Planctomycetes bacterium]|nr:translation elongation factor Ts [Planctomycetota bacterium]